MISISFFKSNFKSKEFCILTIRPNQKSNVIIIEESHLMATLLIGYLVIMATFF